jgi:hypothetical protein
MRAIRDEAYRNNPDLEKELRSTDRYENPIKETGANKNTNSPSTLALDKSITADQRTNVSPNVA